MQEFKFFDTIFNDVSIMLDVNIEVDGKVFRTTAISDDSADLRQTICSVVFSDPELTASQQAVVDSFITTFNDRATWLENSVTGWPMHSTACYDDGSTSIRIKAYTLTDGSREIETEVTTVPPTEQPGEVIIKSATAFVGEAVKCGGFAFLGFADDAGLLPAMEMLATSKSFALMTFSPLRGSNLKFSRPIQADPEQVIAIEAAFITDMIRGNIEQLSKLPTCQAAVSDHGVTYYQLAGPRNLIFSGIQPYVHALVGLRPLEVQSAE